MANTIILPCTTSNNFHTLKRNNWHRSTTLTNTTHHKQKSISPSNVHNSLSNLPDIVNDCHHRTNSTTMSNDQKKLMCKQIANSLRLVADQVDKRYCQDVDFHREFQCFTIRLMFHTVHIRSILHTLWTRSFLPLVLLIFKTKSFI